MFKKCEHNHKRHCKQKRNHLAQLKSLMYPQLEVLTCSHLKRDVVELKKLQRILITMVKAMEQLSWEREEFWQENLSRSVIMVSRVKREKLRGI